MISDTKRRIRFCFFAVVINFLVLALPKMDGAAFYYMVSLGVLLNMVTIWVTLKGTESLKDESEHLETVGFSRRIVLLLGIPLTIIFLVAAFSQKIEKQAVPFIAFGYVFLLFLPIKILDLAVERRMREMRDGG